MFKEDTVFILGAGASWHYGYPTGADLVELVKEGALEYRDHLNAQIISNPFARQINSDNRSRQLVRLFSEKHEVLAEMFASFSDRLEALDPPVIDYFLGVNPSYEKIGKFLIADILLECEKKPGNSIRVLNPKKSNEDIVQEIKDRSKTKWVRYVLQHLMAGCRNPEDLLKNNVKFVTFNYDTSLETALRKGLERTEYFQEDGLIEQFFKDRIYHVYGKLEESDAQSAIEKAYEASQGINVIAPLKSEEIKKEDRITHIQDYIAKASYLYILGYGFDDNNNEILGLNNSLNQFKNKNIKEAYITNFNDRGNVARKIAKLCDIKRDELQNNRSSRYEYSTNNVHNALAHDFDFPAATPTDAQIIQAAE